jgi:hypothetical protein
LTILVFVISHGNYSKSVLCKLTAETASLRNEIGSRGNVMIVIPKTDHRLRKIVFVPDRAQARRAQQKIPARISWVSPQPLVGENANEMSAGKEQHIFRDRTNTINYTVCPLADLCWRFPSRGAVAEQLQSGRFATISAERSPSY